MGVNSLPKTVTLQRRDCDLNPSEYSTLTYTTLVLKKVKVVQGSGADPGSWQSVCV